MCPEGLFFRATHVDLDAGSSMTFEAKRGLVTIDSRGSDTGTVRALTRFRPRAVLFWWAESSSSGKDRGNRGGIGIHTDGGGAVAHAWFADDQIATDRVAHAVGDYPMYSLASPLARAPACYAEAEIRADGFVLHWTATIEGAWEIQYLAFGGSDLREAAITRLNLVPEQSGIVADVGFRPDFALFIPTAGGSSNDPSPGLFYGLGVAAGPNRQGATGIAAEVAAASAVVRSTQRSDCVIALPSAEQARSFRALAKVTEFGASGPELAVAVESATSPVPVACLALAGGRYSVAMQTGPTRPGRNRTRGVGFAPAGLLAFSWGLASSVDIKEVPRLCIGAADLSGCSCLSWSLRPRGLWPLKPRSRSTDGKLLEVVDTRSQSLHAHARLTGFRADGFRLDWGESDGHRREFVYAAFGSAPPSRPRMIELGHRLGTWVGKKLFEDRFSDT